ncbi:hypothetical protein K4L04_01990 [Phaeobacter inhibens]|uniref:hypothetical protein n=1 Tax=Phaeobacter inhibens TaxID=221822 RepID=UPI0021A72723|nr:hypothetical protein [Phaeobacter inhibens]UWR76753.1 hypothetical protein K4L04_01990 [Phaeobacter inhibens]
MMTVEQDVSTPSLASGAERHGGWPELGWQPDVALRLFGMRRSGNHAVANWLQRNAPGQQALFFNNCKPGRAPLTHHQGGERNALRLSRHEIGDLTSLGASMAPGGLLLISYEDTVPSDYGFDRPVSGDLDEGLLSGDVLLLRGFLNWSASLLKKLQGNPAFSLVQRNAVILRAIDSYRRMLKLASQANELALVVVDYDHWMRSANYRKDLLDRLDLPVADNTLGKMQTYGGGSSFDKDQGDADFDLKTDQRCRQMVGDAEYQAILHLAARDEALLAALTRHYPDDAARLSQLAEHPPFTAGGLF